MENNANIASSAMSSDNKPPHSINPNRKFFSKMTKQMLKGIRGTSKEELANRIYLYFDEVTREPVIYRWTYKMEETTFLYLILQRLPNESVF